MTTLEYVLPDEFRRVWSAAASAEDRAALVADLARLNTLSMVMEAGSGHIGSSFSSLDLVSWVYLGELGALDEPSQELPGIYFSSKGHDAPGLYALLTGIGRLDFDLVHRLRRLGGLPGHPDVRTPGMPANTGSLGMGISKAKGMLEADRLRGVSRPVFVMTGDGELQEGQVWESLQGAVNRGLSDLTVIVDHNKIQSDTWVSTVSDLGDLEAKFRAFGWAVRRCDGHDLPAVAAALRELRADPRPGVLVADTVKGRGVAAMEEFAPDALFYPFHSGAPGPAVYAASADELRRRIASRREALGLGGAPATEVVEIAERTPPPGRGLVPAWASALVERADRDPRVVALDGDLVLDTGLDEFRTRFPERFVECGIAEMDMVSMAGGMALEGLVPVVHSFASFLSGRPHEQVLVNATEGTKVVYVGALAGILPGGPGHSHQCVTDAASFGAADGMLVVEPAHPDEVAGLLDLALDAHDGPVYVRMSSPPVDMPVAWPQDAAPAIGVGTVLRAGEGPVVVLSAGSVLTREVLLAAEALAPSGVAPTVAVTPWFNRVDDAWLTTLLEGAATLLVVENHVAHGGLATFLAARIDALGLPVRVLRTGVDGVPACGQNPEVLRAHGLDAAALADRVRAHLS